MIGDILAAYGPGILGAFATAIAGAVGLSVSRQMWLRGFMARLLVEARAVVLEVEQTYVDGLRAGRADTSVGGAELTPAEATEARRAAIVQLRSNLGRKGLSRLVRVLGLDSVDRYLATHVEAAVKQISLDKTKLPTVEVVAVQ